ncbi:MAG: EAL domain-containing protein [Nitrosomonadales bacterium]
MLITEPVVNDPDVEEALKNCEREAIHQVGQIQPVGLLLALDDAGLIITHVSDNVSEWFDFPPSALLGQPFASLVGEQQALSIRQLIGMEDWRRTAITTFKITRDGHTLNLDAQVSRTGACWIIEIEQDENGRDDLFHKLFIPIRDSLWQLDAEADLFRYTQKVVEQVRLLTGYDRVMMYQFDDNWDGEVIAESRADDIGSYLGNHFPAADIPPQARSLYTKNLVRMISVVDATPVKIQSQDAVPLDLTYSSLRALSPVHLQYLRNMGVNATLSISLLQNGRLWGLIACHHREPKYISMRVRELDEFIGKTVSLKLSNLENGRKAQFHEQIHQLLEKLTEQIRQNRDIGSVIDIFDTELLSLVHADGAIINLGGNRYHIGSTPSDELMLDIESWLRTMSPKGVFQTDNLSGLYPKLAAYQDVACGLMIAPLDRNMHSYISWFRNEITKTIKWAGKPDKVVKNEQGRLTISPRESFSTWVETFRDKSPQWSQMEIDAANSLALALIEVLTHHALEQSEENYRFLTDNSSDMIARFDLNGNYIFLSPSCLSLFGFSAQHMTGRAVTDFIMPEDCVTFQNVLLLMESTDQAQTLLFRSQHDHSKTVWIEYTLKRIINPRSGAIEIVANGRDVTQRHTYQLAIEDLHRRNTKILEAAGDGLVSISEGGQILYANERVRQILGWDSSDLVGKSCCQLFHARDADASHDYPCDCPLIAQNLTKDNGVSARGYFGHKDGRGIHVDYSCTPMKDHGKVSGAVLVFREPTEQNLAFDQKQTNDAIINEASEAVMVTGPDRRIVSVNRAFMNITGYVAEEVIGQTPRLLRSGVHTQNFYNAMYVALEENGYWAGEIWNRRKNGEIYPQWGSITAIFGEQGDLRSYIAVFSDVSKAKQTEERLYHLANHDPLTGLANRSKFVDYLNHTLDFARRNLGHKVAVAFIDMDRFKIINDTLGHTVGDQFLKAIATRISSQCRNEDLLSRWGGDEFVLVMDRVEEPEDVVDAISRMMDIVRQPLLIDGHELEPTLSVGISFFPNDADNTTDLVKAADTAMYRVKENGRNGYAFFTEHQADESKKKFEIVSELNRALRLNEFVLNYQPQVKPDTGEIVGLEALIRWQHPERGYLSPFSFIPLAEELGMINQVGEWVIKAACLQMSVWKHAGVVFPRVAVNVSPSQLDAGLADYVQRTLALYGLTADCLEIELTEGALERGGAVAPVLKQLREMGITLSIDDFGTGYSSLGHLKNFPINCFKIDKSFVDGLPGSVQDAAIVKTILTLGENLNVEVVVEGVETMAQRDFLTSIGAKIIQGYCYDKPLSVEKITERLKIGHF